MSTLSELKGQVIAEAWQGIIYEESFSQDGDSTRHIFSYFPKDVPIDTGKHNSDLSWLLRQRILVDDEAGPAESAYWDGAWLGPLYNAFLRWIAVNIEPPLYVHSWRFVSSTVVEFTQLDVSSGTAVDAIRTGELSGGDLVVN